MNHAYWISRKAEDRLAYRAQLRAELESFKDRRTVVPRSHGRVLKAGE